MKWTMELTRKGYADALVELGHETENVVVFDADLAASTLTRQFAKAFPARFFDMGIAEQGMVATAAGMALMGFRPFVTSYAMFVAGRAWEIIRQQISYGECPVCVVGAHGGISVGKDGPTHQCTEDLALMRVLPKMNVVVPCDYWETFKVVKFAGTHSIPFYFRMGREKCPVVTSKDASWELGKAYELAPGNDGAFVVCGLTVSIALEARELLEKEGIRPRVINNPSIKPFDRETLLKTARECGAIVTAEEHSVIGGLGSTVVEILCQSDNRIPVGILGLNDRYLESGPPEDLLEKAGLTPENLAATLKETLRKRA